MSWGELLITLLLRGALVLLAGFIVTSLLLRRVQASTLRWVWVSIFAVLFALPFGLQWQAWQLPIQDSVSANVPVSPAMTDTAAAPAADDPFANLDAEPLLETPAANLPVAPSAPPTTEEPAAVESLEWWFIAWVIGAASILLFVACGHLLLGMLCRRKQAATASWQRDAKRVADDLQLARAPRVYTLDKIRVPTTAGIFRHKILVPPAAEQFTAEERRATLVHELSHVRGRDPLFILLAHLVLAIHWCNPFAWLALRALRQAQERRCDDAVITSGKQAGDYAEILIGIAAAGRNRFPAAAGLALAMAKPSSLRHRIHLILDKDMKRNPLTHLQKIALAGAVFCLAAPLALTGIGPTIASAAPGDQIADLQKRLDEINIAKIHFDDASLEEATDYLRKVIAEQGQEPINFVVGSAVMGGDPYRGASKNTEIEKQKKRMAQAEDQMEALGSKFGVIDGRESLMRQLAKAAAEIESAKTELEILESMEPEEIAATQPDAGFVRSALERYLAIDETREVDRKSTQKELIKRCEEYLDASRKRIRGREKAYNRLELRVSQALEHGGSYSQAKNHYEDAQNEIRRLTKAKAEVNAHVGLVNLKLNNISLAAALKYIAQQAGVELSVEAEAVVFGKHGKVKANEGTDLEASVEDFKVELDPPTAEISPDPPLTDPADTYLTSYMMVREADGLLSKKNLAGALKNYLDAYYGFKKIHERSPNFEPAMVVFRMETIVGKIEIILQDEEFSELKLDELIN